MKSKLFIWMLAATLAVLSGCAVQPGHDQEQAGMVIGGVLGGVLGSNVGKGHGRSIAIIAGTLIGASIGSAVGRSMDETDRLRTAQTLETVRTGVPSRWKNPDTGNEYSVTPTRTYEETTGPCREYTMNANIGGKTEKIYGKACRQADGSWRVQG